MPCRFVPKREKNEVLGLESAESNRSVELSHPESYYQRRKENIAQVLTMKIGPQPQGMANLGNDG
jgi:hypothetical protein